MNKRAIGVKSISITIVFVLLLAFVYITIDIERNKEFRFWLQEHFQKINLVSSETGVYLLGKSEIIKDKNFEEVLKIYREHGQLLMNLNWLSEVDSTFHYDFESQILSILSNGTWIIIRPDGSLLLNDAILSEQVLVEQINDEIYLDISALSQIIGEDILGFNYKLSEDGQQMIYKNSMINYREAEMKKEEMWFSSVDDLNKSSLRNAYPRFKQIFEPINLLGQFKSGDRVIFYTDNEEQALVYNGDAIGYIPDFKTMKEHLPYELKTIATSFYNKDRLREYTDPIFLVWEAVYSKNPDPEKLPKLPEVNIVAPTWVELVGSDGSFTSKVSEAYLQWAGQNNKNVWLVATNGFDPDLTHNMLRSYQARQHFIQSLVDLTVESKMSGINLDFENIYLEDQAALTHFVNELAWVCARQNIVLSMDVTVIGGSDNWSKCYDRRLLGQIVDYLVIMTYDEYWASSPVSGPVSSLDWVERSMQKILLQVPAEKLILGLPFYTRVWTETFSNNQADKMVTKSNAISMKTQNELIQSKGLGLIWDEKEGLFYTSYIEENAIKKIWVENEVTLALKAELVKTYGLKGIGCWRRGFEVPQVYPFLNDSIQ